MDNSQVIEFNKNIGKFLSAKLPQRPCGGLPFTANKLHFQTLFYFKFDPRKLVLFFNFESEKAHPQRPGGAVAWGGIFWRRFFLFQLLHTTFLIALNDERNRSAVRIAPVTLCGGARTRLRHAMPGSVVQAVHRRSLRARFGLIEL